MPNVHRIWHAKSKECNPYEKNRDEILVPKFQEILEYFIVSCGTRVDSVFAEADAMDFVRAYPMVISSVKLRELNLPSIAKVYGMMKLVATIRELVTNNNYTLPLNLSKRTMLDMLKGTNINGEYYKDEDLTYDMVECSLKDDILDEETYPDLTIVYTAQATFRNNKSFTTFVDILTNLTRGGELSYLKLTKTGFNCQFKSRESVLTFFQEWTGFGKQIDNSTLRLKWSPIQSDPKEWEQVEQPGLSFQEAATLVFQKSRTVVCLHYISPGVYGYKRADASAVS